jgi:hypothetical protein
MNAPVLVPLEGETDPLEIATKELKQKKIPLVVRRYLPGKNISLMFAGTRGLIYLFLYSSTFQMEVSRIGKFPSSSTPKNDRYTRWFSGRGACLKFVR